MRAHEGHISRFHSFPNIEGSSGSPYLGGNVLTAGKS